MQQIERELQYRCGSVMGNSTGEQQQCSDEEK